MMPLPNFYLVLRVQLVSTLNFQGESWMSNKKKLAGTFTFICADLEQSDSSTQLEF